MTRGLQIFCFVYGQSFSCVYEYISKYCLFPTKNRLLLAKSIIVPKINLYLCASSVFVFSIYFYPEQKCVKVLELQEASLGPLHGLVGLEMHSLSEFISNPYFHIFLK